MDFHPIPYRGDPAGLEQHYLPKRGKAGTSVQSFFAQEQESRVLCYTNANLTRSDSAGEPLRFAEFWFEITGVYPEWLYFDSKATNYPGLSKLNQRGIWFITIRRRGAAILRYLQSLPGSKWKSAVIDTVHRRHQHIRYVDERVNLPGYDGQIRQIAVTGLGREQPTLFLSNNEQETARSVIIRYAGRNRVEDALGISVNFFHLDCLASEVRLNVDLDATLTVLANGCYRWLAKQLRGFENAAPKQLYRKFVETSGSIEIEQDRIVVRFDKRSHNPILREAALDQPNQKIPWLQNLPVVFKYVEIGVKIRRLCRRNASFTHVGVVSGGNGDSYIAPPPASAMVRDRIVIDFRLFLSAYEQLRKRYEYENEFSTFNFDENNQQYSSGAQVGDCDHLLRLSRELILKQ